MTLRPMLAPVGAAALVVLLLGGCSSDGNPYDALSDEAVSYVIPDSQDWTYGEMCSDGGDCGGPITLAVIEDYDWYRISDLSVVEGDTSGTVQASLVIQENRSEAGSGTDDPVVVKVWGPDVEDVEGALADGYEIWGGVDISSNYAVVFAAFDEDGRFAGIGNVAAEYFTVPVAELAAAAEAPSGFAYLDPIMSR